MSVNECTRRWCTHTARGVRTPRTVRVAYTHARFLRCLYAMATLGDGVSTLTARPDRMPTRRDGLPTPRDGVCH